MHNCTLHDLFYSRLYPYNISNLQSQVKLAAFKTNHKSARVSPQLLTSFNVLYNVRITGPNRPQIFTRRMAFSNESILFSFLFHRFVSSYAQRISKVIPTTTGMTVRRTTHAGTRYWERKFEYVWKKRVVVVSFICWSSVVPTIAVRDRLGPC